MNRNWTDFKSLYGNLAGARVAFEDTCETLYRKIYNNQHVSQIKDKQGDGGIDIFVGEFGIKPITVIQCKFFLEAFGKSQQAQIRNSFETSMTSTKYELKEWILCIPRIIDIDENAWWFKWKHKQLRNYSKEESFIKLTNGNELIDLLKEYNLYNQIFKIEDSKKISEIHKAVVPPIKHNFNSQLKKVSSLIKEFKTLTSISLINNIIGDINDSSLDIDEKNKLNAHALHQMALCKSKTADANESFLKHIESYKLQPNNLLYKEYACTSYFNLKKENKALEIADEILAVNEFNERANAIKLIVDDSFHTSMIPNIVLTGHTFKRIYCNYLLNTGKPGEESVKELLHSDFEKAEIPGKIDFLNLDYWQFIGKFAFHLGMKGEEFFYDNTEGKDDYSENILIKYSNKILGIIHTSLNGTELYNSSKYLKTSAFFYFHSQYLLTNNDEAVSEMLVLFRSDLSNEIFSQQLYTSCLICLSQLHRFEEILDFIEELNQSDPTVHLIKYRALFELERTKEAYGAFIEYIKRVEFIGEIEILNILIFADSLLIEKENIISYYKKHIESLQFEIDLYKVLAFSYYHRYDAESKESVTNNFELLSCSYPSLTHGLQIAILSIYQALDRCDLVVSFIEQYHKWQSDHLILRIYTHCLLVARNDSTKLLEVLKYRRDNFPEAGLFLEELRLYQLQHSYSDVLECAESAIKNFEEVSDFKYYRIYSLYKLKKEKELKELLNENLLGTLFHWKQKYTIAQICLEMEKTELGLELFYQEVKLNGSSNPAIKQHYFALGTLDPSVSRLAWPKKVELDSVVEISTKNGNELIRIDEYSIEENWIVKKIMGLEVNHSIKVEDPLTHKIEDISILKIMDKYSGMVAMIADEIGRSNFSGMKIRSFKFNDSSVESIKRTLIENFGELGDTQKIQRDEAFNQYYTGKLSFSELVMRVSDNAFLETYSYLTSPESDGFFIFPLNYFNNIQIDSNRELVIDMTTLPILMKVSEGHENLFKDKFIISQFAIELLESELLKVKLMQEDSMSFTITSSAVRPYSNPPGYKQKKLDFIKRTLNWIQDYCEVLISDKKLDMLLEHPDLLREGDMYYNYLIDTAFISHERILISDDRIHNKHFRSHYLTISVEFYLLGLGNEIFKEKLLPILIYNHYIGLTLDCDTLIQEFKRPVFGSIDTFRYCLENLPFPINSNTEVFNQALDFIRYIYTEDSPLEFRRATSQKVILNALKGYPDFYKLRKNLLNEIKVRFALLQVYLPYVLEDFSNALEILNRARK
jgi:hypothetical protein